jgi:hypothetical protein
VSVQGKRRRGNVKVVLVVTWILGIGAQGPAAYQIPFDSLDLCNEGAEKLKADVSRLEKERLAEMEAAQQAWKNPEFGPIVSTSERRRYEVSAVCLVTSAAP